MVIDSRHDSTRRLNQSGTTARLSNGLAFWNQLSSQYCCLSFYLKCARFNACRTAHRIIYLRSSCQGELLLCSHGQCNCSVDGTSSRFRPRVLHHPRVGHHGATFLMVFLIQNTQNRDTLALQLKLSELILSLKDADNRMAGVTEPFNDKLLGRVGHTSIVPTATAI